MDADNIRDCERYTPRGAGCERAGRCHRGSPHDPRRSTSLLPAC